MTDITVKEVYEAPKEILSDKILTRFVDFLDVSDITLRSYKAGISQFINYLHTQGITRPSREDILNFKNALTDNGRKPATVALYLSSLRRFFDWTATEGIYPNITAGVKAPRQDKGHKRDFLTGTAIRDVLTGIDRKTLEGKRNYAMMLLITTGGLRTVEAVRANIADISTRGGFPVLYVQGKGRTSKADYVKLPAPVLEAINDYLKARGQVRQSEPLFVSCSRRNHGQRLTTRTVSGVCKKAMQTAGYNSDRLTAHSLRHSAVTLALMAGQTLAEVQYFARHSSINTTMIYAHNVDRLKSECEAAIFGAVFSGMGNIERRL